MDEHHCAAHLPLRGGRRRRGRGEARPRQRCTPPRPTADPPPQGSGVKPPPRPPAAAARFRREARAGRRAIYRRHPRARGHAACRHRPVAEGARAPGLPRCLGRARRARRRGGAHRRRHSRQERRVARLRRRSAVRRRPTSASSARRSSPSSRRRATSRAAPSKLAAMEIEAERPSITVEDALERGETVLPDYAFGRGDAGCGDRRGAAAAGRPVPRRRPGAFLSRRPDRAGDPGRGRRHPRLFLDPASDARCSTWSPACSAFPTPT